MGAMGRKADIAGPHSSTVNSELEFEALRRTLLEADAASARLPGTLRPVHKMSVYHVYEENVSSPLLPSTGYYVSYLG